MNDSPLIILGMFAASLYLAKLWSDDYRAAMAGNPNPKAFPGVTPAPLSLMLIGVVGALVLVGIETGGEIALGVSAEQSTITWLFLLAMVAAGFFEEVIFRGYLVITDKGRTILYASILGFSLLFTLAHYQYYLSTEAADGSFALSLDISAKSSWTLLILFLNSLWFYALRFMPLNRSQSLLPCFAAHIASNLGVFVVKLAQGHVVGLY